MSAASFEQNYLNFLADPRTQRSIEAQGEDPFNVYYDELDRQRGIRPKFDFNGQGGRTPGIVPEPDRRYRGTLDRTPGIVPEFESDLTDMNRGQQMMDSTKRFYDSLEAPGIRDRVDLFLGGLAGSPSFEVFPPDIDSPGENAARERYRQQNPGPVRGRTWDQIQRDMPLIRARMGLKGV